MPFKLFVVIFSSLLTFSCTKKSSSNDAVSDGGIDSILSCENSFVVSNSAKTIVYHRPTSESSYRLYKTFSTAGATGSFIDCESNTLVIPISLNDRPGGLYGISFIDLQDNSSQVLQLSRDGMNSVIYRYRNGFLVSTGAMHRRTPDEVEIINDSTSKPIHFPSELFAYTHYVDIPSRSIRESYKELMANGVVFENTYLGDGLEGLITYDLTSKKVVQRIDLLREDESRKTSRSSKFVFPQRGQYFAYRNAFYLVVDDASYDAFTPGRDVQLSSAVKKDSLYKVDKTGLSFHANIPSFSRALISPSQEGVFIIENDLSKIVHIDLTKPNKTFEALNSEQLADHFVVQVSSSKETIVILLNEIEKSSNPKTTVLVYNVKQQKVSDELLLDGESYIVTTESDISIF